MMIAIYTLMEMSVVLVILEKEAEQCYYELLEEYNKAVKNKCGRPRKTNTKLTYNVPVEVKAFIELEALRLVNQGVIVEKIVNFYKKHNKKLINLSES